MSHRGVSRYNPLIASLPSQPPHGITRAHTRTLPHAATIAPDGCRAPPCPPQPGPVARHVGPPSPNPAPDRRARTAAPRPPPGRLPAPALTRTAAIRLPRCAPGSPGRRPSSPTTRRVASAGSTCSSPSASDSSAPPPCRPRSSPRRGTSPAGPSGRGRARCSSPSPSRRRGRGRHRG